jgi:hypothetical protein
VTHRQWRQLSVEGRMGNLEPFKPRFKPYWVYIFVPNIYLLASPVSQFNHRGLTALKLNIHMTFTVPDT